MRIQNWPALVGGCLIAALIGQSVLAADRGGQRAGAASRAEAIDDSDPSEELSGPGSAGGWANPFQPVQYGDENGYPSPGPGFFPAPDGGFAPGIAPSNAWPTTSPYENRISQTSNVDGMWQNYTDNNYDLKWVFSLEYLYSHGSRPGVQTIGDPRFSTSRFGPGTQVFSGVNGAGLYPDQTTSLLNTNLFHNGFRPVLGYDNPDDSGVRLSGFILFETDLSNELGKNNQLSPVASIIVNNNGLGLALPFDKRFFQQYSQEIMGADLDLYQAPFYTWNAFKLKAIFGVKYLRIHENLYVEGDDSGLNYTVSTTGTFSAPVTRIAPPYATIVNSSTTNNLLGPILGLRYDLGGDKFKVWGFSKFGVMADIDRSVVSSSNLGQIKVPRNIGNAPSFTPGFAAGLVPFSTVLGGTHTHIAPLFETAVNIEFPFFSVIPYVNKLTVFRCANVRIGYDLVLAGEVSRAAENINYNLGAAAPNNNKQWFDLSTFNFGLDWKW